MGKGRLGRVICLVDFPGSTHHASLQVSFTSSGLQAMLRRDGLRHWSHLSWTGQDGTGERAGAWRANKLNEVCNRPWQYQPRDQREINHKKLLIKTLAISLFPFPSFPWWGETTLIVPSLSRIQRRVFCLGFQRAGAVTGGLQGS